MSMQVFQSRWVVSFALLLLLWFCTLLSNVRLSSPIAPLGGANNCPDLLPYAQPNTVTCSTPGGGSCTGILLLSCSSTWSLSRTSLVRALIVSRKISCDGGEVSDSRETLRVHVKVFLFLIFLSLSHQGSCTSGQPCSIHCTAFHSCDAQSINYCGSASSCLLTCEAEGSCQGATFDCPSGGTCESTYNTSFSLISASLYLVNIRAPLQQRSLL